jgi:hypothetical protein
MVEKSSEIIFNVLYISKDGEEVGGAGFLMFNGDVDLFESRFYADEVLRFIEKTPL